MTNSIQEFSNLAARRGDAMLSLYMPTHEAGPEIRQDHIRFKNLLAETERMAHERDHDEMTSILASVKKLKPLVDDAGFWRHQGAGLAIFAEGEDIQIHRLPTTVNEFAFINQRFVVRPLLPAVSTGQTFYILDLNENAVRLIAASRDGARQIDDKDIPESLEDALGYDVEQKSLQFHTEAQPVQSPSDRAAMFHGHGSGGEEDENKELRRFLEIVDNAIRRLVKPESAPLLIAGVERVISTYQDVTKRDNVLGQGIEGNHEHQSIEELRQMALPIVEPELDKPNQEFRDRFHQAEHTDKAVAGLDHVLIKAKNSRVDTLFIDPDEPVWGNYSESDGVVLTSGDERNGHDDLLDRALHDALSTGARVIPTSRQEIPGNAPVAALLRF